MLSTPLMIGGDLTKISEETLKILKNKELIAINQNAACRQAVVIKEYKTDDKLMAEIWVKNLRHRQVMMKESYVRWQLHFLTEVKKRWIWR